MTRQPVPGEDRTGSPPSSSERSTATGYLASFSWEWSSLTQVAFSEVPHRGRQTLAEISSADTGLQARILVLQFSQLETKLALLECRCLNPSKIREHVSTFSSHRKSAAVRGLEKATVILQAWETQDAQQESPPSSLPLSFTPCSPPFPSLLITDRSLSA